jgi:hypothetical protein
MGWSVPIKKVADHYAICQTFFAHFFVGQKIPSLADIYSAKKVQQTVTLCDAQLQTFEK